MALTKPQRARLDKLASYLEGLPKGYRHFDMLNYLGIPRDSSAAIEYARKNGGVNNCGTVACAVGHGPAAGILVPPRYISTGFRGHLYVDWDEYCTLFIGGDEGGELFDWCFASQWADIDNSHWGAAARIRYLLAHGAPPKDFHYLSDATSSARKLYAPYRIDHKAKASA